MLANGKLLVLLAILVGCVLAENDQKETQAASCDQSKFTNIQACATCCAISGFNKMDRQAFLKEDRKDCRCYMDAKEVEKNQARRVPKPKPK